MSADLKLEYDIQTSGNLQFLLTNRWTIFTISLSSRVRISAGSKVPDILSYLEPQEVQ